VSFLYRNCVEVLFDDKCSWDIRSFDIRNSNRVDIVEGGLIVESDKRNRHMSIDREDILLDILWGEHSSYNQALVVRIHM